MNTNCPVVSALAAVDLAGKEHYLVTMTSTGINLASAGATTTIVGTLMRANTPWVAGFTANQRAVDVALKGPTPLPWGVIGNTTASIATGALLDIDPANPGMLVPHSSGTAVAMAWDAMAAPTMGSYITIKHII